MALFNFYLKQFKKRYEMKMNLFILVTIAAIVVFTKIVSILITDINSLTKYGFGYLTGLIITFLILLGITVVIGFQLFREKRTDK